MDSSDQEKGSLRFGRWLSPRYYKPQAVGSYSGARAFHRSVKDLASYDDVTGWLKSQDAYTLHKTPRRRFPRRKTIVSGINEQWQCDLMDLSSLKSANDGMTFVLTMIDVFSKVGFAIALKNKTSSSVIKGLEYGFDKSRHGPPRKLQTDKGSEFLNRPVQSFLKENGVHHFVSENAEIKCAIVERWNRTLKEKLWRYFTKHNTRHYLTVLPQVVSSYNHSYHRSIGMAPLDVTAENEEQVWQRLYGESGSRVNKKWMSSVQRSRKRALKVGDRVRLSKSRRHFKKGYLPSWTTETFVVTEVLKTSPTTYRLVDERGEAISGTFYLEELQAVVEPSDKLYKIDKVLKRRGNKVFVRWEGYPPSFDSWIQRRELKRV